MRTTPSKSKNLWLIVAVKGSFVRSSHQRCYLKVGVIKNFVKFTRKHLCQGLFFNLIKKETLAQVFSCEFCEIFKNIFFTEQLQVSVFVFYQQFQISGETTHLVTPIPGGNYMFKVNNRNTRTMFEIC